MAISNLSSCCGADLKACPFCGGPAHLVTDAPEYFVSCDSEKCRSGATSGEREKAVAHWNARPACEKYTDEQIEEALKDERQYGER